MAWSRASGRRFDKGGENFYDQISALHKSVRGSDPDAALYWMVRMLDGGADPRYLTRRMIRMATEDVGLADPRSLEIAMRAAEVYERLGSPEGELALAECVVYLAVAPKSNAVYVAYGAAREFVSRDVEPPGSPAPAQRAHAAHEGPGLRQGLPLRPRRGGRLCGGRALPARGHGCARAGTSPPTAGWRRRSARSSRGSGGATRRAGTESLTARLRCRRAAARPNIITASPSWRDLHAGHPTASQGPARRRGRPRPPRRRVRRSRLSRARGRQEGPADAHRGTAGEAQRALQAGRACSRARARMPPRCSPRSAGIADELKVERDGARRAPGAAKRLPAR